MEVLPGSTIPRIVNRGQTESAISVAFHLQPRLLPFVRPTATDEVQMSAIRGILMCVKIFLKSTFF